MTSGRLDCETRESAEQSLVQAFGCTPASLQAFLKSRSHLEYFEANYRVLPDFDQFLFQRACAAFGAPALPHELCWFHCTRVPDRTDFREGILPLGQVVQSLEHRLLLELDDAASRDAVARAFAKRGGHTFHFGNKLADPIHRGPFAILVRDVALCANEVSQHDYLRMPEIIEDLCDEVRAECGLDLLGTFGERWRPAIVKFVAPAADMGEGALTVALRYLRALELDGKPDMGAVWCFDGEGRAVNSAQILKVEFLSL